ncbi:CRIB domain-containing protein RIC10-like, partial [Neltuma alba]|uniref:CRIB domain-containing protein RIC10-like n=1 Tax=Neltuma alba TaxID=207710 RepID=UPI0010A2D3B2
EKDENDEMQIGFPTDVKHVAHIGLDGPSANTPSWMTTLNSASEAPELLAAAAPAENSTKAQQGNNNTKGETIMSTKEIPRSKPTKDSSLDSPTRRGSDEQKHVRRHRHTNTDPSSDSLTRGSAQHARQHQSTIQAGESSSEDTAEVAAVVGEAAKQHYRRKSKTSNGDAPVKSSKRSSKGNSLTKISLIDIEARDVMKHCESLV